MRLYRQWLARCRHISLSGSAAFVDRVYRVECQLEHSMLHDNVIFEINMPKQLLNMLIGARAVP